MCGKKLGESSNIVMCSECIDRMSIKCPGHQVDAQTCDWCGEPLDCGRRTLSNSVISITLCARCAEGPEQRHVKTHMERVRLAERVNELQRNLAAMTKERDEATKAHAIAAAVAEYDLFTAQQKIKWLTLLNEVSHKGCMNWIESVKRCNALTAERDALKDEVERLKAADADATAAREEITRLTAERDRLQAKLDAAGLASGNCLTCSYRWTEERASHECDSQLSAILEDMGAQLLEIVAERNSLFDQTRNQTRDAPPDVTPWWMPRNDVAKDRDMAYERNHDLQERLVKANLRVGGLNVENQMLRSRNAKIVAERDRLQGKVRDLTTCNDEQAATIVALRANKKRCMDCAHHEAQFCVHGQCALGPEEAGCAAWIPRKDGGK